MFFCFSALVASSARIFFLSLSCCCWLIKMIAWYFILHVRQRKGISAMCSRRAEVNRRIGMEIDFSQTSWDGLIAQSDATRMWYQEGRKKTFSSEKHPKRWNENFSRLESGTLSVASVYFFVSPRRPFSADDEWKVVFVYASPFVTRYNRTRQANDTDETGRKILLQKIIALMRWCFRRYEKRATSGKFLWRQATRFNWNQFGGRKWN